MEGSWKDWKGDWLWKTYSIGWVHIEFISVSLWSPVCWHINEDLLPTSQFYYFLCQSSTQSCPQKTWDTTRFDLETVELRAVDLKFSVHYNKTKSLQIHLNSLWATTQKSHDQAGLSVLLGCADPEPQPTLWSLWEGTTEAGKQVTASESQCLCIGEIMVHPSQLVSPEGATVLGEHTSTIT